MRKQLIVAALAATSTLLAGCVVAPAPVYPEAVMVEPPPPRIEYPGYPPFVGYIWIGGYWTWTGHRHEWVPGRWEAPRPGYRWIAPRWERDGSHWRQHEGRWEHDGGPRMGPGPMPAPLPAPMPGPRFDRHDGHRPDVPAPRPERGQFPPPVPAPGVAPAPAPAPLPGPVPRREFDSRPSGPAPTMPSRGVGERREMGTPPAGERGRGERGDHDRKESRGERRFGPGGRDDGR